MKYLFYCLFALIFLVHSQAEAQCFSNNLKQGKEQMAKGNYQAAKAIFQRALKCPDSQKAEANKYIQECNAKIQQAKELKLKARQEKEVGAGKQKAQLLEEQRKKEELAQREQDRLRAEQEAAERKEQEQKQRLLVEEREAKERLRVDSLRRIKEDEESQKARHLAQVHGNSTVSISKGKETVGGGLQMKSKTEPREGTQTDRKNPYFIRAGVYGTIYAGNGDDEASLGERLGYMSQIGVGKYLNPYIAVRVNLGYGIFRGASVRFTMALANHNVIPYSGYIVSENISHSNISSLTDPYYGTLQKYIALGVDGMFSLWRHGEHFFRPSLVVGVSYLQTLNKSILSNTSTSDLSPSIGVHNAFRLNRRFYLNVEGHIGLTDDKFDLETSLRDPRKMDSYFYFGLGLSYTL